MVWVEHHKTRSGRWYGVCLRMTRFRRSRTYDAATFFQVFTFRLYRVQMQKRGLSFQ
jgi:hypothetical protein